MLTIKDLNVFYGGVHALHDLSIHVPAGSIVTLIGANGAGKSTTLRSICGLVKNVKGEISYDGKNILNMSPFDRVTLGIAMVPEGRRVFTNLSVVENLRLGAYSLKDKRGLSEDMEKIYTMFPILKERMRQRALTLSGGEQQMLAVGRALMSRPRLLLMDEPSLGLAPLVVKELYQTIKHIHQTGLTVLVVEQNARLALQLADYGYVMEVGRVALEGPSAMLAEDEGVKKAYIGA